MIETSCPSCGKAYRLKPELAGRKARCRNCSNMFLVPDEEIDDLDMESVAIESFRPPARPERRISRPAPTAGIDFSAGYEADEDDEDESDAADFRPRPANRPPAWKTAKKRTSHGPQVPVSVIVGVPAAIAVLALIVIFVVPLIKGPSIAEITGLDEALVAQFEMSDDPPIGSPAPADMKPVVGRPTRDMSGYQLVLGDIIDHFEEVRKTLAQITDFATMTVAMDRIEKVLEPRFAALDAELDRLPDDLTKKEEFLVREYYVRYALVIGKVLDEYDRLRANPETSKYFQVNEDIEGLRKVKTGMEEVVAEIPPEMDSRPEGDPTKYAELRVVGTDTPEMKACFEARLFTRHPIKYIKIHQNGTAPTRYAVWPIDDVSDFARGIQAGRVVHVTGREVWVVVEPLSAAEAEQDRIASVEFRKKYILSEADKIRQLREAQGRINQEIAKSIEDASRNKTEIAEAPPLPARADMPRNPRSQRSAEIRRQMMGGSRMPEIPGNTGGAAAGLRPVNDAENRGRPLVVTVGSGDKAGSVGALAKQADSAEVQKAAGQKDAFDIAMERIRDPHRQEDAKYGMGILLKIDLEGRETQLFSALAPYLDSPLVENAAMALVVLERIDDPRRVDEVVSRLGKNRQTDPIFCNVLAKWKDPRAIEPLTNQLDGFPLWKHFDKALIDFGPAAEKAVIAKLSSPEKDARKRACEILGQIGGDESLKVFAKLKPDTDPFVRIAANAAITSIRTRLGIPAGRRAGR